MKQYRITCTRCKVELNTFDVTDTITETGNAVLKHSMSECTHAEPDAADVDELFSMVEEAIEYLDSLQLAFEEAKAEAKEQSFVDCDHDLIRGRGPNSKIFRCLGCWAELHNRPKALWDYIHTENDIWIRNGAPRDRVEEFIKRWNLPESILKFADEGLAPNVDLRSTIDRIVRATYDEPKVRPELDVCAHDVLRHRSASFNCIDCGAVITDNNLVLREYSFVSPTALWARVEAPDDRLTKASEEVWVQRERARATGWVDYDLFDCDHKEIISVDNEHARQPFACVSCGDLFSAVGRKYTRNEVGVWVKDDA